MKHDFQALYGVAPGTEPLALITLDTRLQKSGKISSAFLYVASDPLDIRMWQHLWDFFTPPFTPLFFPAWDCLPYDRTSPDATLKSHRRHTLETLATAPKNSRFCIITTANALLHRVPPARDLTVQTFSLTTGKVLQRETFLHFLSNHGYTVVDLVRAPGEYALRGSLIDVFPSDSSAPLRIDLFGDQIEQMRVFDPLSQRSTTSLASFVLNSVHDTPLTEETVERFRCQYRALFGLPNCDPLYEAISAGRPYPGMEHWWPLFHEKTASLFDYLPKETTVILQQDTLSSLKDFWQKIQSQYGLRQDLLAGNTTKAYAGFNDIIYKPLPPEHAYMSAEDCSQHLTEYSSFTLQRISRSLSATSHEKEHDINLEIQPGLTLGAMRTLSNTNVFEAFVQYLPKLSPRKTILTFYSEGSQHRISKILHEHGAPYPKIIHTWKDTTSLPAPSLALTVLPLEHGFQTPDITVISETDLLGERLSRPRTPKNLDALNDLTTLNIGDLIVHQDHGVGRYEGLTTLKLGNEPHDCLVVIYHGGDKLFVPVENMNMLSRYGASDTTTALDRLGSIAWQHRKARVKKRLQDIADHLIQIAAERRVRTVDPLVNVDALYQEFCAGFPYAETDDQLSTIDAVIQDLASGKPMDRLVCGDVGFGKTEVALRAAFAVAANGQQVAVVVPTTLLCRQHYLNFQKRFAQFPMHVEQLSRLITPKQAEQVRTDLANGKIDIIIATHTILSEKTKFHRLGLLIIDEEHHFGVSQKEKLKDLKKDVHVLTLTATPIPRTLQMALSGVREMSLIATPPLDRLVVHTFILPFDGVTIREAILREQRRGGQTFYVCPKIADLEKTSDRLKALIPEVRIAISHGQMPIKQFEDTISAFCDGAYDVLLSTNIVESGIDIPRANTLIVHRADLFGLAQLYQLRGRVGRSNQQAFAYFTLNNDQTISSTAQRRLEVLQQLDTLGAGFTLAAHDMDIRGAGNLLGEEQSGHIKEIGVELYQHLLQEAIHLRQSGSGTEETSEWTPHLNLGLPVLIPDSYVPDLTVRLQLYRRIANLTEQKDIDGLAAELVDRFGVLPAEVENLLESVSLKILCRAAHIAKVDVGEKGSIITFYQDRYPQPERLITLLQTHTSSLRLRPDQKLILNQEGLEESKKYTSLRGLIKELGITLSN